MRSIIAVVLLTFPAIGADPITWLGDYNIGRREASDAGKGVCLVIGTEQCIYCRKLEAVTLADVGVTAALKKDYIAIKLDGNREAELSKALKVTLYPTTVLAASDGTIHAIINGYVAPAEMRTHLEKTTLAIADTKLKAGSTAVAKDVPAPTAAGTALELEKLKAASLAADEKAAGLQLQLAEALAQHGDAVGAKQSYERVVQMVPNTSKAHEAQLQLTKLKGPVTAVPASMKK